MHDVVIVGGGPVGLAAALALRARGVDDVVVLERRADASDGSRAIAMTRRTLHLLDDLGVGAAVVAEGLPWHRNRAYYGTRLVYEMEFPTPAGERHPPFLNLQQRRVEQLLAEPLGDAVHWSCDVTDVRQDGSRVALQVPGAELEARYAIAADGAHSAVRKALGLAYVGETSERRYVICDYTMPSDEQAGRRLWFDPPYSRGSTVLMHRMPGDIWRIDYQLRDDQHVDDELRPERVRERIGKHHELIGEHGPWDLHWISVYRAHAFTLERYDHGRVVFAGDAAHQLPIFGGRGLNHGYADAVAAADAVARALAGEEEALRAYSEARTAVIHATLAELTKTTVYMTRPSQGVATMRDAVLSLSLTESFVRELFDPFRDGAAPRVERAFAAVAAAIDNVGPERAPTFLAKLALLLADAAADDGTVEDAVARARSDL